MSKVEQLATRFGFRLHRESKHRVLRNDDGKTLVLPSTPSDGNWEKHCLSDLAKLLGKRKADLIPDRRPLRATREKGTLEPLPALIIGTEKPHRTKKLTSKERQRMKRMKREQQDAERRQSKHEQRQLRDLSAGDNAAARRAEKERREMAAEQESKQQRLIPVIHAASTVWLGTSQSSDDAFDVADSTVNLLQRLGWERRDCEIVLVAKVGESIIEDGHGLGIKSAPIVRCGFFYLDFYDCIVRASPTWTILDNGQEVTVEAICSWDEFNESAKSAKAGTF